MYTVTIGDKSYEVAIEADGKFTVDGTTYAADLLQTSEDDRHLILDNKSYNIKSLGNPAKKHWTISVNGDVFDATVADDFDRLLEQLGLAGADALKINELKAPMPGLVLDILVEEGQVVEKDTPLMVLEAMKMENVIKAPSDVTVGSIEVNKQDAVEKNAVLIAFA